VINLAGYGLVCHRAIRTAAELMGIKDLHCKVEGSTKNVQAVTRAFFDALVHQVCNIPNYCQVNIQTFKMLFLMCCFLCSRISIWRQGFKGQRTRYPVLQSVTSTKV